MSGRVKVRAEVSVYQRDEGDWGRCDEKLGVESHWNDHTFVVLHVGEHRYTVVAGDLRSAIEAAAR